jgi:hypothetical protein
MGGGGGLNGSFDGLRRTVEGIRPAAALSQMAVGDRA